jgi:hypothetical protein
MRRGDHRPAGRRDQLLGIRDEQIRADPAALPDLVGPVVGRAANVERAARDTVSA